MSSSTFGDAGAVPSQGILDMDMETAMQLQSQPLFRLPANEFDEVAMSNTLRDFNAGLGQDIDGYGDDIAQSARRSFSPYSERLSPAALRDPSPQLAKYEFRNINRQRPMTWLDQDKSGNYDPEEEARKHKEEIKKKRAAKVERGRRTNKKLKKIVRLKIFNPKALELLQHMEDNWSDGHSVISIDEPRPSRRGKKKHATQIPIPDPAGELADLTGHPAARGCVACRKNLQACSMVEGGTWPCNECIEDDVDLECQHIITPKVKDTCRRCASEGIPCSFAYSDYHEGHCDQCLDAEMENCVAGPAEGHEYVRISMDTLSGPDRKYASCNNCRRMGKRCSLKTKQDKPPCNFCRRENMGCTFHEKPRQKSGRTGSSEDSNGAPGPSEEKKLTFEELYAQMGFDLTEDTGYEGDEDEEMDAEPKTRKDTIGDEEMVDHFGHRGRTCEILTSFAHPVSFTIEMDPNSLRNCSFCSTPIFGIIGHGEKEVSVLKWSNGLGHTELINGHREENHATSMCAECTMARLQIIICQKHSMKRYLRSEKLQDVDDAAVQLASTTPRTAEAARELERWCSLCFNLATFKCCTPTEAMMIDEGANEAKILHGCGLKLCDTCQVITREEFDGVFKDMVKMMDGKPKMKANGEPTEGQIGRVDVGLLHEEGLLYRNMQLELAKMDDFDD